MILRFIKSIIWIIILCFFAKGNKSELIIIVFRGKKAIIKTNKYLKRKGDTYEGDRALSKFV